MVKRIYNKLMGLTKAPPVVVENEFINWISFVNAGMLNMGNIYCFDHAIKNLPSSNPVVEIGSFCGLSTNVISYLLGKYNKTNKIISADKWIFEGAENGGKVGDSSIDHEDYKVFVKDSYKRNVQFFSKQNLPFTIEVFSDEFFELWFTSATVTDVFNRNIKLGGPISFAYIDGNHTYEFAKRDFVNVARHLEIGGFVLFDDSSDDSPFGSTKLMKEVVVNPRFKLILKNPNYLFQKVR